MATPSDDPSQAGPDDPALEAAAPQALLEVSTTGQILWAAPEASDWWSAAPDRPLAGQPLAALFDDFRDASSAETAWEQLLSRASTPGAVFSASAGFSVRLLLTRKGEPDAQGQDAYIALVERDPNPAAGAPISTDSGKPGLAPHAENAPADPDEPPLASLLEETADDLDEPGDLSLDADLDEPDLLTVPTVGIGRLQRTPPEAAPEPEGKIPLLEGSRIGFFHINLAEGSARFSPGWKDLLGYQPDDVADEPDALATLIHPEDSEASPLALTRAGPFSAEIRLRTKEDSWRWMQFEGVCNTDPEDRPERIEGIMLDAQERRDAEEETAQNEARFLRLTARGHAGFFEMDLAHDTAWYSAEFRRTLGHRADELGVTPDGFLRVLPAEDAEVGLAPYFESITRSLPVLVTRYALLHADGRLIELDVFLVVRRNRRGTIEHICGLQAPVGDKPPAQEQGPRDESAVATGGLSDAIQSALDAAAEGIVLIDLAGRILHVNTRAAAFAGDAPEKLATRSVHEVFTLVDRTTGVPAPQAIDRVLAGGQPVDLDQGHALLTREGPEPIALSCRPVFDLRRKITGATVVLRRSAEMPLSQAELVKSNRMEALGRLACGIVHDFNNLLTTVVGGVSLAIDKRDLQPLDTALKACNNAKSLARQLLTFARGDVTGRRVQSLNDIIRETARMAGAGSKTTVELELSADLHPVNVVTSQLVQVFTNLILNAMQVMPTGGRIWVRTLNMPLGQINSVDLPAGEYVRADVQDNGPGIPPENLARIFEPFFTTRAEGTGLGLAMVNSIVAQHEGAIEASSTVGSGTTFTLYFPRAQSEVVQEAPQKLTMSYGSGRVLVMDDDVDLCAIAKGMLEMLGYEADTAGSADDAITLFRKSRELNRGYSAVVLDLTMAGGPGGEDVVARLREIDPAVKAIVSSGYATDENAEHYRKLGFAGILSKPYRSADLGRVLKEVVGTTSPA